MPQGSISVRKRCAAALLALALPAFAGARAGAMDDASAGYRTIRPSLVKVWAFDGAGRPIASGTGLVVTSNERGSEVLTASHVVAGAASIRIDVSRDVHDLSAHVERAGPRDLTLLDVDHGNLQPARFAPASRAVVSGNIVAVAGYVKNDELIGVVGQEPRVLYPGTVSSRPDDGAYLELENVYVEEGLSGGPVFDPQSGQVLGIVTSRTSDARGGFADSGAQVVVPFLTGSHVALNVAVPPAAALPSALPFAPAPRPLVARVSLAPTPAPAPLELPTDPPLPNAPALPAPAAVLPVTDPLLDPGADGDIASWRAGTGVPQRFVFVRDGCTTAVVVVVRTLQFVVAHRALVPPHRPGALLAVGLRKRVIPSLLCGSVASTQQAQGAYEPTVMAFDGRHVTMRFVYAGDPANADLFPSDASLDADLDAGGATATVQFFDRDWNGAISLSLARTALATVSESW